MKVLALRALRGLQCVVGKCRVAARGRQASAELTPRSNERESAASQRLSWGLERCILLGQAGEWTGSEDRAGKRKGC